MKRSLFSCLVLAGGLLLGVSLNAQTVATDPVGFENTTVQGGTIAALGVPFDRPADFQGAVSSRTSTTLTTTGAGFGSFGPFASNPHAVIMLSGANIGRRYLVDSNTTDTITISTGGDLTTQIAATDKYKVVPCHTLASLFGATGTGMNVGGSATTADNVQLRVGGAWLTYFNTGTQWARVGTGATNQNNTAVLPEQGFLFVRRPGSDYTFTGLGAVPTTALKTDLPANAVTNFSNRFPKDTTLVDLGLHSTAGWVSGGSANSVDQVLIRSGGAWLTYFYTGSQWARVGTGATNQNATPIPIGVSVLVVRRPGSDITLTQPLPYTL